MLTPAQVLHHPAARWIGVIFGIVLTLHLLLSTSTSSGLGLGTGHYRSPHELWYLGKQRAASFIPSRTEQAQADAIGRGSSSSSSSSTVTISRENATFVTLCRNSDLWEILGSMRGIEGELLGVGAVLCEHPGSSALAVLEVGKIAVVLRVVARRNISTI